ncbi:response regulator [Roseateles oligotrophus]|uniref:histidine kinase n=1 Tax=Roseateles oligotrophus TaxID=1769250 RepID=A0ABT2YK19_9BURK|nr:response regulator [Roseateles oligotrophus]MCV2370393.1 response regulator [Roseateles oligotrophus]
MSGRTIQLRVFLPLALLLTLLLAVGSSFVHQWVSHRSDVRRGAADTLLVMADKLSRSARYELETAPDRVSAEVALEATELRARELAVISEHGLVVAHAFRLMEGKPAQSVLSSFNAARFEQARQTRRPVLWSDGTQAGIALSFGVLDGAAGPGQIRNLDRVVVWVVFDLSHEMELARFEAMKDVMPVLLAAVLICAGFAVFLWRQVTAPLSIIGRASQELATSGQLAEPVPEVGPWEVKGLAQRFNSMAQHIQRARHDIETARERIAALVDSAMDAIITVDGERRIVMANRSATALFGVEEAELLGQSIEMLMPERYRERHPQLLQNFGRSDAASRQMSAKAVVYGRRWNGEEFPAEASISRSCVGEEEFYTVILRDVTERQRAEEAIRKLNASLEATVVERTADLQATAEALARERDRLTELTQEVSLIVDSAPVGILLLKDRRVLRANVKAEELLGYGPGEAVGSSAEAWYLSREDYETVGREMHTDLVAGRVHQREMQARRQDGTHFWVRFSARRLDRGGESLTLSIIEDISAEHAVAEALAAAKVDAVKANEAKSQFLANMSHEIRTPMNAIIGMAHLALRTELSDTQRDYLHKIQLSSQHLLGVINDILDFSKVEAGKLVLEHIDFQLLPVLDNVFTLVGSKANEKGLELVLDVALDVPNFLIGDPLRLGQVLINLCSNAVKFTERGQVVVRVHCQTDEAEDLSLHIEVQDTGIGLSAGQIAQLFQSFQQADSSTTRMYGGTGLGLAISQRLVHLMGGEIGVRSEPGQGSTFWFTVQLQAGATPCQDSAAKGDPAQLVGRRALVVDDNAVARQVLQGLLHHMGLHSDAVNDGDEAVAAVRAAQEAGSPYDIVLLDWSMPHMNGIDAGRAIRALPADPKPRLMLVTGRGREEVLLDALESGFSTVMVKPVNASVLLDNLLLSFMPQVALPLGAGAGPVNEQPRMQGRALVVEDNAINQQIAREMLQDLGLTVEIAGNGREALDRLERSEPFDLVFMDMHMPVMDGLTATKTLRSNARWAKVPVIAMTANVMSEDRERCSAAGMNDFVAKPVDPNALAAVVRRWMPSLPASASLPTGPVPVANDPRLAPLQGIHGLDLRDGLRRCGHKTELYLDLLRRFVESQATALLEFGQLSADPTQDTEHLRLHLHSLKGVAGNLGATLLHSRCEAAERQLRADPLLAGEAVGAVESTTRTLGDALRRALGMHQAPGVERVLHPGAEAESAGPDLKALGTLLHGGDPDALAWVEQHKSGLQALLGADAGTLFSRIHQFEYDEALKLIEAHRPAETP